MIEVKKFMDAHGLTLIMQVPVLWLGWDCDYMYYVCKDKSGNRVLVATDHGKPKIGSSKELKERIKYYREVIETTELAIRELNKFGDDQ
jgi:hypothetical protein